MPGGQQREHDRRCTERGNFRTGCKPGPHDTSKKSVISIMPPRKPHREPERNQSAGFILVAVLWILVALTTLVMVYAVYVRQTAAIFPVHTARLRTQALAEAGVELAAYQLLANRRSEPTRGHLKFQMSGAVVDVDFRSENAFIDLNAAPQELLAGLFSALGASQHEADQFSRRIVAWRTPSPVKETDDEAGLYRTAGLPYGPRRGAFQSVHELGLVLGLTPTFVDRALPYLTVYSGQPEIDVLDAAPMVLAALPGVSPERLHDIMAIRANAPLDVLTARFGARARLITVHPTDTYRIGIRVVFHDGSFRAAYDVDVMLLRNDQKPYSVLSWHQRNQGSR